jgi:hypothetical protein
MDADEQGEAARIAEGPEPAGPSGDVAAVAECTEGLAHPLAVEGVAAGWDEVHCPIIAEPGLHRYLSAEV